MRSFSAILLAVVMALSLCFFTGCKKDEEPKAGSFYLYYKETSAMNLHPVEGFFDQELSFEDRVSSVFSKLRTSERRASYVPAIPESIQILSATLADTSLIFDFNASYSSMSTPEELLMRAAVVKTFTQMPEVSTVEFRVEGQPLVLSNGTLAGTMKSSDFKDIFGSGLNAYTETRITLFFADETGTKLKQTVRELYYSNQISLEQCAIQQLIAGPSSETEGYAVLPSSLKMNSITVRDGVCHVDFSTDILTQSPPLPADVIIFSVVNTLTGIPGVTSVRISINTRSDVVFMDTVDLSQLLYRNLDIIENSAIAPATTEAP